MTKEEILKLLKREYLRGFIEGMEYVPKYDTYYLDKVYERYLLDNPEALKDVENYDKRAS